MKGRTVASSTAILAVACTMGCVEGEQMMPGSPKAAVPLSDKPCPRNYVIDDMEDDNNQVIAQMGRGGYWYTFADKAGTAVDPAAGAHFGMSQGGANGSGYAARVDGKIASTGAPLFAGMGFSFTDPKAPYDASAFSGITFFARVAPGSAVNLRLKVPDVDTDPDGHRCTECFNDFGADLTLSTAWTQYTIAFDQLTQMEGWGAPRVSSVDKSKIYGIQWQATQPGSTFDVWVDDVAFTGCP